MLCVLYYNRGRLKRYLLIAALFLIPLAGMFFTPDMVHTHDGPVHLARIAAYYKALLDGQFPVRWAGELNYGYGTPVFIFLYPFPYTLGALFVWLGASLTLSFKLILAASFVLSGVFFYGWMLSLTRNKTVAAMATALYQFAPYRFVELTVRGSMAEAFGFAFAPLVLWMITKKNFPGIAIATALLVLSHNSISLVFFGIIVLYMLFAKARPREYVALAAGLGLAAFYWVPALLEHKYTYGDLFMKDMFRSHFAPITQFFLPNPANLVSLQTGGVATWIGFTQTLAVVLALWTLWKQKAAGVGKTLLPFGLVVFGIAFLFMTPASTFLWEKISFLRQFQFPWRLLAASAFSTGVLAVAFPKKAAAVVILVTILSTLYFWRPPLGFDRIDESYFWNYPLNTTFFGEADVIWSAGPATGYPSERVQVAQGNAVISDLVRHTDWHSFSVQATGEATLVSNTQYFPGWQVLVDGAKVPIQFQDPAWRGLLVFTVPDGAHDVMVRFGRSKARLAGELISVITVLLWLKKKFLS